MIDRARIENVRASALAWVADCQRTIERAEAKLREAQRIAFEAGERLAEQDRPN